MGVERNTDRIVQYVLDHSSARVFTGNYMELDEIICEEFPPEAKPDGLDEVMALLRGLTNIHAVCAHLTLRGDESGQVGTGPGAPDGFCFGTLDELREETHKRAEQTEQLQQQQADIELVEQQVSRSDRYPTRGATRRAFGRLIEELKPRTPNTKGT